jgi:hypothetical protein
MCPMSSILYKTIRSPDCQCQRYNTCTNEVDMNCAMLRVYCEDAAVLSVCFKG